MTPCEKFVIILSKMDVLKQNVIDLVWQILRQFGSSSAWFNIINMLLRHHWKSIVGLLIHTRMEISVPLGFFGWMNISVSIGEKQCTACFRRLLFQLARICNKPSQYFYIILAKILYIYCILNSTQILSMKVSICTT